MKPIWLPVRLLCQQSREVHFSQGLRQKSQQGHLTCLRGCQAICDHVRLRWLCISFFSQSNPWKTHCIALPSCDFLNGSWHCMASHGIAKHFVASLEESVAATSSSRGIPLFRSSTSRTWPTRSIHHSNPLIPRMKHGHMISLATQTSSLHTCHILDAQPRI